MKSIIFCLLAVQLTRTATADDGNTPTIEELAKAVKMLARQVELQQFQFHERIRTDGNSGIKQLRVRNSGTRNYHSETHNGRSIASIHDHSNYIRTIGIGEFTGVLNGVEFLTRHNDYRLVMPSRNGSDYHAVEDIPFPPVPPEVLAKKGVAEQAAELREWFKAWHENNPSHRNFTKYFRPVLCYLEGAWFEMPADGKIQESFKSERHFLDASRWDSLHDRVQFMAYSGAKSRLENLANLPTAFFGTANGTILPQLAQFNYRILCHPIEGDLPTKYMHVMEDFSNRLYAVKPKTMSSHVLSRAARFGLNAQANEKVGGQYRNGLLDKLMNQIPGKNNYPGKILSAEDDPDQVLKGEGKGLLNMAYYHRYYQLFARDAMGLNEVHRSYSDDYAFAAQTTHEVIAGMSYTACKWVKCEQGESGCNKKNMKKICPTKHERWTWAFPLEIIYLTPLHSWDPHNIGYKTENEAEVTANSRNGRCEKAKAYNGVNRRVYYRTPVEFFTGSQGETDKADTVRGKLCVLNKEGEMVTVAASGVYIVLPEIKGVGKVRIRYPIMPVHAEGNTISKELNAVRQLVMNKDTLKYLLYDDLHGKVEEGVILRTQESAVTKHTHQVSLSSQDLKTLQAGGTVSVVTTQVSGHTHILHLRSPKPGEFVYTSCDGQDLCFDKHGKTLLKDT